MWVCDDGIIHHAYLQGEEIKVEDALVMIPRSQPIKVNTNLSCSPEEVGHGHVTYARTRFSMEISV